MKRILSMALVVVLVLSSFPFTFAQNTQILVHVDGNKDDVEDVYVIMSDQSESDDFEKSGNSGLYKMPDGGNYVTNQIEIIVVVLKDGSELEFAPAINYNYDTEANGTINYRVTVPDYYTVTFEDHDGTVIKTETVESGSDATPPADPSREGYTFAGWSGDYTNVTSDTTVTATYNENFIVTFEDHDGTVITTETVASGDDATPPADPTREGYTFSGWSGDYTNITSDTTITATYEMNEEPSSYTVTFEDHDGTVITTETVASGDDATPPADPTREGYTFSGWSGDYTNITSDTTITATYEMNEEPASYTVTFEDHDGTIITTETVASGDDATPPADPTREGYTFSGWSGDYTNITSDTTITATYEMNEEPASYTVTFEDHDGTVITTETVASGDDATPPADPSRDGYTFSGWSGDYTNITSDTTITATYEMNEEPASYTVTFEDHDGTVITTETVASGDDATPPADPSRDGYTFSGWSGDYTNITSDTTITATYEMNEEPASYTVTFEDHDGTVITTETVASGDDATPPADPSRDGYTFSGWSGDYTNITSDTTITATYEMNEESASYTVTFEDHDGTVITTETVASGDDATPPADPAREGYTFSGWSGDYTNITSDTTITATYEMNEEPASYTVTFEDHDGTVITTETVASGDDATPPADPSRDGYTFTGWSDDYTNITSDTTITATYEEITETTTTTTTGGGGGGSTSSVNAVTDTFTIVQNEVLEIEASELMDNDTNADSFESVQNAIDGTVSLDGTTVTFIPDEDFIGRAYFNYTIEGDGDTDSGLVIIDVEEGILIEDEITPLGSGDPDAFLIIEPDIVPLGIIDYSLPYIIGYPDETFRPEREVTRAEMAAIFARILSLDMRNPGEPMYEDVSEDDWYYKYVQAVTRVGLFSGYEGDMFKPNRPVSHAEIAAAFSRYWELRGIEIETDGDSYTDIEGHWAQEMINRLYNAGISASYANGEFKPDAFTTRTELVVMVNRSLNRAEMIRETPSFEDVLRSFWGFGAIEAATGYQEPESVQLD